MTLLYDLIATQPNNDGDFHGGGKYGKKVFFALGAQLAKSSMMMALFDSSKPLDPSIKSFIDLNSITLLDVRSDKLDELVKINGIDRIYSAQPFGLIKHGLYDLIGSRCEVYCTIHGLRTLEIQLPLHGLNYFSMSNIRQKAKYLAKLTISKKLFNRDKKRYYDLIKRTTVITVSEHTKYSIMSFFPEAKLDLPVFYSPDVTEFEDVEEPNLKLAYEAKQYFFMISGNRWLKNNLRAAIALDELFENRKDLNYKVVITGVTDQEVYLSQIKNKERFVFLKYVSETHLKQLYTNALAFIYLSLNEGFGYPPLEAMKVGTPVVTSPFTSIPEVCGDAVLYSNPYSIPEIQSRLLQVINEDVSKMLVIKGLERYRLINEKQKNDLFEMTKFLLENKNKNMN